jgi:transcriptional regulator with XRE-family HTH domain
MSRGFKRPGRGKPQGASAKVRYLTGRGKTGSPEKVARDLGVSKRTVREWLTGKRAPSKANAAKLQQQVDRKYEHAARETAKAAGEPYVNTSAGALLRMRLNGPVTMLGQTGRNYARPRSITQPLTGDQAERVGTAYLAGDAEALYQVAREAMADYFNTGAGYSFGPDDLEFDLGSVDFE